MKTNKLANEDDITTGQVLDIPKLETTEAESSASPVSQAAAASPSQEIAQASPSESPKAQVEASKEPQVQPTTGATGGANTTIWGPKIDGDTYTVVEGDWLSTISARSYGDIMAFDKIAKANNISNPNLITPGMILKIPR